LPRERKQSVAAAEHYGGQTQPQPLEASVHGNQFRTPLFALLFL
jgi:hypothetical protein